MSKAIGFLAVLLAGVALTVPASAAEPVSLSDIEDEVMCPTCGTALSLSESPVAQRQRVFIQRQIDMGRSKEQIKAALAREFGQEVLATPPRKGFSIMAYLVPIGVAVLAVFLISLAAQRRRSSGTLAFEEPASEFDELIDDDLRGVRRLR
jgi:cytochrome c-type biogenesis protein CcmH